MIKPQSVQNEYSLIFSGDPALSQKPKFIKFSAKLSGKLFPK